MQTRAYQEAIIAAVSDGWREAVRQLVVAPTGSGKTIVFSFIAKGLLPGRTLILAHRDELIDQAIDKLHAATGICAQKEKAEFKASLMGDVVVASVQTMARRLAKWPSDHFDLIIVDEAHHALADSYQGVLKHFCGTRVCGFTATPDRGDKKNLGQYFQRVAAEIHLLDLIRDGFLTPIKVKTIPLKIDMTDVRQVAGDFDDTESAHALEPYLADIARDHSKNAPNRKTLSFLPLIQTSVLFVELCRKNGLRACHVDGQSEDRKEILKAFKDGEYDLLSNANLLLEGYDDPSIDCILMLRPTKSRPLYAQAIGRGTRIHPGKENLLVLDFLWQSRKHDLIRPAHLIAETPEIADAMTAAAIAGGEVDLEETFNDAKAAREAKLRREIEEASKRKQSEADAMELALSLDLDYEATFPWETRDITEGQKDFLEKNKFDLSLVQNRGHASAIISRCIQRQQMKLATPKQLRWLVKFKHPRANTVTFKEASEYLDQKWGRKRPLLPAV